MYKDHMFLINNLRNYASPRSRITRMIKSGEVIQVRRGIFLDAEDQQYSLKSLASIIYGPSYISFEFALAWYGLIPERATIITSAVYKKNKNRSFHTPVGDFYYYYLPAAVFPYGVKREEENGQSYLIASPEKALLDTLYKVHGITSRKGINTLLINDLRMDIQKIISMDREAMFTLAPLYRKRTIMLFQEWFNSEAPDA
jgi:predicted transcriptional regulator of viral defense system